MRRNLSARLFSITTVATTLLVQQPVCCQSNAPDTQTQDNTHSLKGRVTIEEAPGLGAGTSDDTWVQTKLKSFTAQINTSSGSKWPEYNPEGSSANGCEPRVAFQQFYCDNPRDPNDKYRNGPLFQVLIELWLRQLQQPKTAVKMERNLFDDDVMSTFPDHLMMPMQKWDAISKASLKGRADIAVAVTRSGKVRAQVIKSTFDDSFTRNLVQGIEGLSARPGQAQQDWRPELVSLVVMFRNCDWPPPDDLR